MSSTLLEAPTSSAKFKFTQGMVSPHQIPSYMSAFDYLCVSSIGEGWPNVILEAMACGKPVIATDVGGNPEAVSSEKVGLIVPPQNPNAMSRAMDQAIIHKWFCGCTDRGVR